MSGKDGEEGHKRKRIIQISQGVQKVGISFSDQMVVRKFRLVRYEVSKFSDFSFCFGSLEFSEIDF